MIGWLFLALLGGAAALAVRVAGVRGSPLTLVFAAIMLGAAGYALQGKPGLAGAPVAAVSKATDQNPPDLLRNAMYGTFNADSGYVIAADAMRRSGDERAAVRVLIGGLNRLPQSYILWTELGGALARYDGDTLSPPARFAFNRALAFGRRQPGVYYGYGLAEIRAGDLDVARRHWRAALAITPPGLSYRSELAARLALLERLIAMRG